MIRTKITTDIFNRLDAIYTLQEITTNNIHNDYYLKNYTMRNAIISHHYRLHRYCQLNKVYSIK